MTLFWLVAAAMIGLALALVLPPLLGRRRGPEMTRSEINLAIYRERLADLDKEHGAGNLSKEEYEQARDELSRAMLEDIGDQEGGDQEGKESSATPPVPPANTVVTLVIAVAVPVVAFGLYFQFGSPGMLMGALPQRQASTANAGGPLVEGAGSQGVPSVEEMVSRLEQRLRVNADDPEGWLMLGRSYAVLERLPEARVAFEEAYQRQPEDVPTLVGYAEILARINDNRFSGKPTDLVLAALAMDPNSNRALWLAGIAAYQRGDNVEAVAFWERLRKQGGMNPEESQLLERFIAEATGETTSADAVEAETPATTRPSASGVGLTVEVSLDPTIADRAEPADTVFIFARAVDGPPMPLAIIKAQVKDLPTKVTLDDTMGMTPELKLSQFSAVVVGARVSKSGNATAVSGDLEAVSSAVKPGMSEVVQLSIGQVVP